jgi:hypothetical protein
LQGFFKIKLGDAVAVAQVYKRDGAELAHGLHPAG